MGYFDNRGNYHWPGGGVSLKEGGFLSTVRVYCQNVSKHPETAFMEWAGSINGLEVLRSQPESIADCWFFRIKHNKVELPEWIEWVNGYKFP